jgi:TonB-linked SusC/RagA family outer membrane protein
MKNINTEATAFDKQFLRRALIMAKIYILILLCSIYTVKASDSYAQNVRVNLELNNVHLSNVIKAIKEQTEFEFAYDANLDQLIMRKVSINVKNEKIDNVLVNLLKGTNINFKVIDRIILLSTNPLIATSGIENGILLQQQKISGIVTDAATGESLPGVSVFVEGTTKGTVTGTDGKFSLDLPNRKAVLVFSFIGYETQKISTFGKSTIMVQLRTDVKKLDEVVVVGYGTQKKGNLTGSVASVKSEVLSIAPVASTANTLAGRLPGLIALQSSGQPGSDQASLSIRGFGQALLIVDGVETDFNSIDPNQIESVSILKDGSASIYGSRAGNGVILVTTKRGIDQKPIITLNSSYTLQGITAMTQPVSSGQYAELQNEKFTNQGLTAPYTADQIQKYYNGTDPQYPNTNWFKETIRDWAPQQQHNLSVRGGSDKIKYYGFFGYLDQESMWKSNGGDYGRYNLQSNIDAKVTDNLSIQLDLSSVVENKKFPVRPQGAGINTLWQDLWNSLPIYPATLPDPTKNSYANGQGVGSVKLDSDYGIAGYNKTDNQDLKGTFVAKYNIAPIKGLSAKVFINYERQYTGNKVFNKPYQFYTYDASTKTYTLAGSNGAYASLDIKRYEVKNITSQFSLNYDRTFGTDHHITALALYENINYNNDYLEASRDNFITPAIEQLFAGSVGSSVANGSASENGRASYVGRLNYTYKDKYLLETSLRADASAAFASDKRWGYFPSVSLGWRLSKENFIKNISGIDELKVRTSYGSSGLDNVALFQYLTGYKFDGHYLFDASTLNGLLSTGLANPNLTWETVKIYNFGTDFSFWGRKLFGTGEVFYRTLSGIPATRILSLPDTFGSSLPQENLNSQNTRGFELSLGTSGEKGDLSYEVSGNISWSRSKWDHYEEQNYTDPDQIRIYKLSGKWTDIQYGYKSDGLFTSQEEISNLKFTYPAGNSSLRPGDIKYVDVNGDGKLDWRDQVAIGKGTVPHWMVGGTINLKYKNFDLSSLFQGAFGYNSYITLQHGGINYSEVLYNLRWSPTNNSANAFVPRLGGSSTNDYTSDHFYKKAGYLRLKALSIGYNLPKNIIAKYNLQGLRVYFAGTNLLTYNKLKDYDVDPEAPSGNAAYYYPQQKTITMGIKLSF